MERKKKKNPIHHGEEQHVAGERELLDRISKTVEQPMQRSFKEPLQPTQRSIEEPPRGRNNDAGNTNGASNIEKKKDPLAKNDGLPEREIDQEQSSLEKMTRVEPSKNTNEI